MQHEQEGRGVGQERGECGYAEKESAVMGVLDGVGGEPGREEPVEDEEPVRGGEHPGAGWGMMSRKIEALHKLAADLGDKREEQDEAGDHLPGATLGEPALHPGVEHA